MGKIKISKLRAGMTLIETLVASLILGVALAAMVSTCYFSYGITVKSDSTGMAYGLGRRALERAKETGFTYTLSNAASSTTTLYYDATGGNESAVKSSVHAFSVTRAVSVASPDPGQPAANFIGTNSSGYSVPSPSALVAVKVTVQFIPTSQSVFTGGTYLVRAGV